MRSTVSRINASRVGQRSNRLGRDTPERRATLRTLNPSKPFSASSVVAASNTLSSMDGSLGRPRCPTSLCDLVVIGRDQRFNDLELLRLARRGGGQVVDDRPPRRPLVVGEPLRNHRDEVLL